MYFLVFTGNRDDSECYDLQGSYYPIQSILPGECIGKYCPGESISWYTPLGEYQTHILARKTLAMLQQWCNPPDAPVPVGRSMITSTIKSMITSTRTPVQSGKWLEAREPSRYSSTSRYSSNIVDKGTSAVPVPVSVEVWSPVPEHQCSTRTVVASSCKQGNPPDPVTSASCHSIHWSWWWWPPLPLLVIDRDDRNCCADADSHVTWVCSNFDICHLHLYLRRRKNQLPLKLRDECRQIQLGWTVTSYFHCVNENRQLYLLCLLMVHESPMKTCTHHNLISTLPGLKKHLPISDVSTH